MENKYFGYISYYVKKTNNTDYISYIIFKTNDFGIIAFDSVYKPCLYKVLLCNVYVYTFQDFCHTLILSSSIVRR